MTGPRRSPPHARPGALLRGGGQAGFTLIEALVAFVILALVMVALQRGAVAGVDSALRAKTRIEAGLVARTLLASATIAETGQPASGRLNGFDWRVRFDALPLAAGTAGRTGTTIFQPMRMVVEIALPGGATITAEEIASVRTQAGEAP